MRHPCLYTENKTRKQKKFKDGFIEINKNSNGKFNIIVFNEENQQLASIKNLDNPLLNGTDFEVGSYLIQVDSPSNFQTMESAHRIKNFLPSRCLPQKNIYNNSKEKMYMNKQKNTDQNITKRVIPMRKLRDTPRNLNEIIAFYDVKTDPTILNKTLVQRNITNYLEA